MAKKKGLQKYADFESIKTKEDFLKFKEKEPKRIGLLTDYLYKKLNEVNTNPVKSEGEIDRYFNRIIKLKEVNNEVDSITKFKRERWYINETHINVFVNNFITKNRYVPTTSMIAETTGLSRVTIQSHLKERKGNEYYDEHLETLRGLTNSVLCQLYKIGIENSDVKALKVYLDYFKEPSQIANTQTNTQNNYIQINGLTISQEQIGKLNPDKLIQIEKLLNTLQ